MQNNRLEEDKQNKYSTMNNFSHKKGWKFGMTQVHIEPVPIPLIKGNYDGKLDKDSVNMKLCRYNTSSTSELYEFRMSLFENDDPEEFLLFTHNFNMTLAVTGMLDMGTKIQYLYMLVHG